MNILHGLVSGKSPASGIRRFCGKTAVCGAWKGLLFLLAAAFVPVANAEVRYWASEADFAPLGVATNWSPTAETLGLDDVLHLNIGTNRVATVSAEEDVTLGKLYIGRGMRYDYETGEESFSVDYDKGARLDVTGGLLTLTNELWVGGGYSDRDSDILNVSGGKLSVNRLLTGDCASNNGKRNEINLSGGEIEITSTNQNSRISIYNGGKTHFTMTGGKFTSASCLEIGSGGTAEMAISGGEFTAQHEETFVGLGNRMNDSGRYAKVRLDGGTWTSRSIHIGRGEGEGIFEIAGGKMVVTNPIYVGAICLAWGSNAKGTMRVTDDADIELHGSLNIGVHGEGYLEIAGGKLKSAHADTSHSLNIANESNSVGRVSITGGETDVGHLRVGNWGDGRMSIAGGNFVSRGMTVATHGTGLFEMSGGTYRTTGEPVIGDQSSATGTVHVTGGEFIGHNDVYIGFRGSGRMVMDGGRVSCVYWFQLNRADDSVAQSFFDFNGGELAVGKIIAGGTAEVAHGTVNWNGGVFKPNRSYSGGEAIVQGNGKMTVNVKRGGAIVDTDDLDREIRAPMSGEGFFEKRGSSKLTFTGNEVNCIRGGFRVKAGTLAFTDGCKPDASVTYREITVEEGATLDLANTNLKAMKLDNRGTIVNGSVTVDPLAGAFWTGAAGDGNAANPGNWEVRTESGFVLEMENMFDDPEVVFIVDGDVKTLANKANPPDIVKSAAGWYDPADPSTITLNDAGGVVGIRNKGTKGAALDLQEVERNKRRPGYGDEWRLNGLRILACTNTFGFYSKEPAGIADGQDRTLIALAKQERDKYPVVSNDPNDAGKFENQMFPIGLGREMWNNAGRFGIEMWNGDIHCYSSNGFKNDGQSNAEVELNFNSSMPNKQAWDNWMRWDMGTSNGWVRVNGYSEVLGVVSNASTIAALLDKQENQRIVVGQRWLYNSPSSGMLAETMYFDRALSADELAEIHAYLQRKWMEPLPPVPVKFRLQNGGSLDLNGLEMKIETLSGSGTVHNAGMASVGTLEAAVKADGSVDAPVIEGDFDLAKLDAIALSGTVNLTTRPTPLLTATGELAGAPDSVALTSDATPNRKLKLVKIGNSLMVKIRGGTVIMLR